MADNHNNDGDTNDDINNNDNDNNNNNNNNNNNSNSDGDIAATWARDYPTVVARLARDCYTSASALIVSVSKYRTSGNPALASLADLSSAAASVSPLVHLYTYLGFRVATVTDNTARVTTKRISEGLAFLQQRANATTQAHVTPIVSERIYSSNRDLLVVHIMGHGIGEGDRFGIVLSNASNDLESGLTRLSFAALAKVVRKNANWQTNQFLFVLDMCQAGTVLSPTLSPDLNMQVGEGYGRLSLPRIIPTAQVLASSCPNQLAYCPDGSLPTVFTQRFVEALSAQEERNTVFARHEVWINLNMLCHRMSAHQSTVTLPQRPCSGHLPEFFSHDSSLTDAAERDTKPGIIFFNREYDRDAVVSSLAPHDPKSLSVVAPNIVCALLLLHAGTCDDDAVRSMLQLSPVDSLSPWSHDGVDFFLARKAHVIVLLAHIQCESDIQFAGIASRVIDACHPHVVFAVFPTAPPPPAFARRTSDDSNHDQQLVVKIISEFPRQGNSDQSLRTHGLPLALTKYMTDVSFTPSLSQHQINLLSPLDDPPISPSTQLRRQLVDLTCAPRVATRPQHENALEKGNAPVLQTFARVAQCSCALPTCDLCRMALLAVCVPQHPPRTRTGSMHKLLESASDTLALDDDTAHSPYTRFMGALELVGVAAIEDVLWHPQAKCIFPSKLIAFTIVFRDTTLAEVNALRDRIMDELSAVDRAVFNFDATTVVFVGTRIGSVRFIVRGTPGLLWVLQSRLHATDAAPTCTICSLSVANIVVADHEDRQLFESLGAPIASDEKPTADSTVVSATHAERNESQSQEQLETVTQRVLNVLSERFVAASEFLSCHPHIVTAALVALLALTLVLNDTLARAVFTSMSFIVNHLAHAQLRANHTAAAPLLALLGGLFFFWNVWRYRTKVPLSLPVNTIFVLSSFLWAGDYCVTWVKCLTLLFFFVSFFDLYKKKIALSRDTLPPVLYAVGFQMRGLTPLFHSLASNLNVTGHWAIAVDLHRPQAEYAMIHATGEISRDMRVKVEKKPLSYFAERIDSTKARDPQKPIMACTASLVGLADSVPALQRFVNEYDSKHAFLSESRTCQDFCEYFLYRVSPSNNTKSYLMGFLRLKAYHMIPIFVLFLCLFGLLGDFDLWFVFYLIFDYMEYTRYREEEKKKPPKVHAIGLAITITMLIILYSTLGFILYYDFAMTAVFLLLAVFMTVHEYLTIRPLGIPRSIDASLLQLHDTIVHSSMKSDSNLNIESRCDIYLPKRLKEKTS